MSFELLTLDVAKANPHLYMTGDEMLGEEIPPNLCGHAQLERSYERDRDFHKKKLSGSPMISSQFLCGLASKAFALSDRISVLFFGGGHISDEEKAHVFNVSSLLAVLSSMRGETARPFHAVTGSGPGVMEYAHLGPDEALGDAAACVGLTLEGLVRKEVPGGHNDNLIILKEMARRLEMFLRMNHAGVIFPGGPGTVEEVAAVSTVLLNPENEGMYYPFVLSEPYRGNDTYMHRLLGFLDQAVGKDAVRGHFILQQGRDMRAIRRLSCDLAEINHRGGYWNWDLVMPAQAFTPFKLDAAHIKKIDLDGGREDPAQFFANMRWFMNLIVKLTMTNTEYIDQNGPPEVRVGKYIYNELDTLLRALLAEERIKTHRQSLDEIVRLKAA